MVLVAVVPAYCLRHEYYLEKSASFFHLVAAVQTATAAFSASSQRRSCNQAYTRRLAHGRIANC